MGITIGSTNFMKVLIEQEVIKINQMNELDFIGNKISIGEATVDYVNTSENETDVVVNMCIVIPKIEVMSFSEAQSKVAKDFKTYVSELGEEMWYDHNHEKILITTPLFGDAGREWRVKK